MGEDTRAPQLGDESVAWDCAEFLVRFFETHQRSTSLPGSRRQQNDSSGAAPTTSS